MSWDDADDAVVSDYQQQVFEMVDAIIKEYLAEGRGSPLETFSPSMPFMEAGLDSLDMLKVVANSNMAFGE